MKRYSRTNQLWQISKAFINSFEWYWLMQGLLESSCSRSTFTSILQTKLNPTFGLTQTLILDWWFQWLFIWFNIWDIRLWLRRKWMNILKRWRWLRLICSRRSRLVQWLVRKSKKMKSLRKITRCKENRQYLMLRIHSLKWSSRNNNNMKKHKKIYFTSKKRKNPKTTASLKTAKSSYTKTVVRNCLILSSTNQSLSGK